MRIRTTQKHKPLLISDVDEGEIEKPIRSREELQLMLAEAVDRRDQWLNYWDNTKLSRKENVEALRNYTALRGVVKALKWALMHTDVEHPLD